MEGDSPKVTDALERLARGERTILQSTMEQHGDTIEKINRIGEEAARLFSRYDKLRQELAGLGVNVDGGLCPWMKSAHEVWTKTKARDRTEREAEELIGDAPIASRAAV